MHKDVNWLESLDMHNSVSWCLRISMRLYFAILGVGKRSLWCAGFTDPPKPSGWYRKYIGNRTIEETSANQKIPSTLSLIKLIGQCRLFYLYCSLLWFEMAKGSTFEKTFAGLLVKLKLFLRNKKKEKKRHSDYRCWHCHIH